MYVLQQKIPQACTPRWMLGSKGEVTIVCAGPLEKDFSHDYYTESGSDGCVMIKAWLKISVQKKPKPGDRLFSILYRGEYGRPFWVYFLLPSRVWLGPIYLVGVNSKNYVLYIFSSSESKQIRLSKLN